MSCKSRQEAKAALAIADRILDKLGVTLKAEKTRIVLVRRGFELLGYKIKRGQRPLRLPSREVPQLGTLGESVMRFSGRNPSNTSGDQIRRRTRRKAPVSTRELLEQIDPVSRGWDLYFGRARVRRLFHPLDRWILRRL